MKFKAVASRGLPQEVNDALGSRAFATELLRKVIGGCLGVEKPEARPAEFYVQEPDFTVNTGFHGVEVRLTGASRGNRTPRQFEQALETMHAIVVNAVSATLSDAESDETVQVFSVIMLDGDVPTGGDKYACMLEHPPVWVKAGDRIELAEIK